MRLACVSVDLDEIPCYAQIHGLAAPSGLAASAVYRAALPRLEALFEELSVPATFFAIGRDVAQPHVREALARLAGRGHEIASHSHNHFYDLVRRAPDELRREVLDAQEALTGATGRAPRGFRAPGYTVSDRLLDVLAEAGLGWDSSVFPCPAYFAAKTAAIAGIAARGRRSHSIVDDPRVLSAPADPYRVGRPYWHRGSGLLELPIGVTRDASGRLPFIGTSVVLAGVRGARWLAKLAASRPLVNLELHGIDLADAVEDDLAFLAPYQPDLRVPAARKRARLVAALRALREAGYAFVTLDEAATRCAA